MYTGRATAHHSGPLQVTVSGAPTIDDKNVLWMNQPSGGALRFNSFGDTIAFTWDKAPPASIELSGWFYFEKFPHAVSTSNLFGIGRDAENLAISFQFDKWAEPESPQLIVSEQGAISPSHLSQFITLKRWHKLEMQLTATAWKFTVDGKPAGSGAVIDPDRNSSFFEGSKQTLLIGNFIGIADDIHVSATEP